MGNNINVRFILGWDSDEKLNASGALREVENIF